MMPHDTSAKGRPSREVREERARAFWQAQINEGRARAAEQQARTNKPAAPPQDPPPSPPPPPRVPLHVVSADADLPPTHAADRSLRILRLSSLAAAIAILAPDQCRHSGWSPLLGHATANYRIARPGASCSAAFPTLTDQQAQTVIDTWLQNGVLETSNLSRPSQSSGQPGLFANSPASLEVRL